MRLARCSRRHRLRLHEIEARDIIARLARDLIYIISAELVTNRGA